MPTEIVYVNSYSEVNRQWTESGSSPWLGDNTDNIYTDVDVDLHDEFGFADPVNTGETLQSVVIWLEVSGPSARNDELDPFIHDGTSWQELTNIDPDGNGYVWYNQDISSILDTWSKVTNAKLRCRYDRVGSPQTQPIYVRRAYLICTYSGAVDKGFADIVGGSDVFTNPFRSLGFSESGGGSDAFTLTRLISFLDSVAGVDVFTQIYREMGFADSVAGADVFTIPWKLLTKAFADTISGSDVFTLLRFLDFVDSIAGADVFTLTRPMDFADTILGTDVFTKATILQAKAFADTISGADVFSIPFRAMGFIDSIAGSEVFDVTLFKAFSDSGGGVDVWTLTRPIYFSDSATGTDVFVTPYREMGFADTLLGTDIFELLRFLAFTDSVTGSDVFTLLQEKGFIDAIAGADVFTTPYREMGFSDVVAGSDIFTQPYREMGFVDTVLGTDVFTQDLWTGIVEKVVIDTGYGLDTFSHVVLMDFADAAAGLDIFLVTKPEIVLRITDGDFTQVGITDGPLIQILITDGALRQVNITEEDI